MSMIDPSPAFDLAGVTLRQFRPAAPEPLRLTLLLHGWTGDENVMWIFASRLPADVWLAAPRAFHPAPMGGYSWTGAQPDAQRRSLHLDAFRPAVERLLGWLTPENFPGANLDQIDIVGFSQGAALGFSLALLHPERVRAVAALAGFMPQGADEIAAGRPLAGKSVFLAHGSQDEIVPVDRARQAIEILQAAGAQVSYCEDAVGHKLSATCFRSLADFFQSLHEPRSTPKDENPGVFHNSIE
jgi:phospholipase/carboxylesterase